jgi:16S rRNA G1207 methylase RsmC
VFSAQGLDKGTEQLLHFLATDRARASCAPLELANTAATATAAAPRANIAGNILDLGCGWGPIALTVAARYPNATIWAVDVNDHAVQLTAQNAAELGLPNVVAVRPEEVPADVRFNAIVSNPPIRIGKAELHQILLHWFAKLTPEAVALLVVQKNLGADSLVKWLSSNLPAFTVQKLANSKGFRIISATTATTA